MGLSAESVAVMGSASNKQPCLVMTLSLLKSPEHIPLLAKNASTPLPIGCCALAMRPHTTPAVVKADALHTRSNLKPALRTSPPDAHTRSDRSDRRSAPTCCCCRRLPDSSLRGLSAGACPARCGGRREPQGQ